MPSLRNRIALVYLVTTGLLLGIVYIAIYVSASTVLYNHYDADLRSEFKEVASSMSIQNGRVFVLAQGEWTESEHGEANLSPVFLQAMDTAGGIVRVSSNLRDTRLAFRPHRMDTFSVSLQLDQTWIRQIQGPIHNREGVFEGYLLVGMGIVEGKRVLNALRWITWLSFPLVLGLILLISRTFGNSIVRPIAVLMSTADHISRENLEERVPLPARADELQRLSTTVNNLLDRLQELIIREQTFAADAAHELRTPLAVLKGTLEVLIRQPREPQQYEEKLRYCISEIDRIGRLVDQLLLLARYESESPKMHRVEVDVAQCVAAALERLDRPARAKRIPFRLSFTDTALVRSDPLLLGTILENLMSNAIKYSPEESPVVVEINESGENVSVSVTDRGPGMTPEQIDKVFNRFYRVVQDPGSGARGFGLGLALVRRLSDVLGIRVSLASEPGRATTFTVVIPRAAFD